MKGRCKEEICEEPSVDDPDVISLLIKLPCGTRFNRRFNKHHSVKELHDYVYAQDEAPRRYQIFTSFPRSPISGCSTDEVCSSKTLPLLKEAGLNKNDTLFVQSVDDDSTEETSDCDSDR
uniref:UBX domain-containing protein n=1 Tax=Ciona savignyi TaxID=51511 RepID=H2Y5G3_CIOSA